MAFVSLPMYAFAETAAANAALGSALAAALARRGIAAQWTQPFLPDHAALEAHWLSPELVLSQACGLPLIEALAGKVAAVGTWNWLGTTNRGRYRSVVVARRGWVFSKSPRAAINGWQSLSGWASLGVFLEEAGAVSAANVTGSHRGSLAALTRGEADVAAIDAVTWSLAGRYWPREIEGLAVLGKGPEIPALPLITRLDGPPPDVWTDIAHEALRAAPAARTDLGIAGFVPSRPTDFSLLAALVEKAEKALQRPQPLRRHA